MSSIGVRVSCDSLVALSSVTATGATLFAKNSDRPALECQPLCDVPAGEHAADEQVRCTYISVPQVQRTHRVIGSRPYWCWGFEHGLNEHGVVIGNHTVFTKEPVAASGLLGMDLVRLGLERATTAREAVRVMSELLATYGQGGSGFADKDWPYHNSFLVADPHEAFVWETSGRHWALRQVRDVASVSNHLTIGTDWDELGPDTVSYAVEQGWWTAEVVERFDFAKAYRDTEVVPPVISSGRHRRTCELLGSAKGKISPALLRQWMRDHYGRTNPRAGVNPSEPEYFTVCMHADPVGTTTASMIAEFVAGTRNAIYWACLGSPCVGAFLPLFLDLTLPEVLTRGGQEYSADSAWWRMRGLLERVEQDWEGRLPVVRAVLDPVEQALAAEAAELSDADLEQRQAFLNVAVEEVLEVVDDLVRRFA
ncbi:MAG: C69 family dipeptidase [Candidatus Binatia bacterium]|nr:C69 family dipeptidase [Candidatus Binatia bacterium]